jgi:hypothetical protein
MLYYLIGAKGKPMTKQSTDSGLKEQIEKTKVTLRKLQDTYRDDLMNKRRELASQIKAIDAELKHMDGAAQQPVQGGRKRGALGDAIAQALAAAPDGLSPAEVFQSITAAGYPEKPSLKQMITAKLNADKRFRKQGRGNYVLSKK